MNYVIIGDIHGMLAPLQQLLHKLEFQQQDGVYQRDGYQAIFLGDLVDRGKDQRAVLELVRAMVDAGHAHVIMGNHEYNAVGFHTLHPDTGKPLVEHEPYRVTMHEAFTHDFPLGEAATKEMCDWLMRLPVFLEFEDFRVAHACWGDKQVAALKSYLDAENRFDEATYVASFIRETELNTALNYLIRGPTIHFPGGLSSTDSLGKTRTRARVKWWQGEFNNWHDVLTYSTDATKAERYPLPEDGLQHVVYPEHDKPIFFGHYWYQGVPAPIKPNIACLDYRACVGGELVAYDWRVEDEPRQNGLRQDRFVAVPGEYFKNFE